MAEMEGYLNAAIGHYRSLFNLPSYKKLLLVLSIVVCVGEGLAFSLMKLGSVLYGFSFGILALLLPCMVSDMITQNVIKADALLTLRRYTGISLFSCIIWVLASIVGATITFLSPTFTPFLRVMLFGFALVASFRFLVINSTSSLSYVQRAVAIFFEPILCLVAFGFFFPLFDLTSLTLTMFATIILLLASISFFLTIDSYGKKTIGIGTIDLFKAFLNSWAEGNSSKLEEKFEELGEETDVYIDLIGFESNNRLVSIIVVPILHPGPFRNVGSSMIPYDLQERLSKETTAIVSVPHGTAGHELDLTSTEQSKKIVQHVVQAFPLKEFDAEVTPLVRVEKDNFKASCQIFGDHALVTLTCSPESTEDLPANLGNSVQKLSFELGLKGVTVIDAHNCIEHDFTYLSETDISVLQKCAEEVIGRALNEKKYHFECGSSKIIPFEFTVEDGIGPGGIVVLTIKVLNDFYTYITIDGNNMIKGLREKILDTILKLGVKDGEVLTTDTHAVNAVGPSRRGYHPIGEGIDQTILLHYIEEATKESIQNQRPAKVSVKKVKVEKVKVLGEKNILEITKLVDIVIERIKILSPAFFVPAIGIVMAMMLFF
jgi:putative membrane protein